ncbi:MAG: hydrogenase, partial [Acidobacteria bacterium]|nr:hydrogenase [Acidobacteriota bacterium]
MRRATEVEVGEQKAPVIQPGHTYASITEKIGAIVLRRPLTNGWLFGMVICFLILQWFLLGV